MRVIFMGSSAFAFHTLEALVASCKVVAVFTSDEDLGFVNKVKNIKSYAQSLNLPTYCPRSLKNDSTKELIYSLDADLIVVASYGLILPKDILTCKRYGCVNVHPSKLPQFRGASPIQHTILSGQKSSAVCIIKMDAGVDTGDILLQEDFDVPKDIYYDQLCEFSSRLGAKLLVKALNNIDNLVPQKQSQLNASYAPKIKKEDGQIIWDDHVEKIYNQVRAFSEWPGSYFFYKGIMIKILKAEFIKDEGMRLPYGEVIDDKLSIKCRGGVLLPKELQRSGKKILPLKEFLLGAKIAKNSLLTSN